MNKIVPFDKGAKEELPKEAVLYLYEPCIDTIFMHEMAAESYDSDEIIPIKDWNAEMWQEFMSKCEKIATQRRELLDEPISAWAVFGTVLSELLEENDG